MEREPDIAEPRPSEALLILVDTSLTGNPPPNAIQVLCDAGMRLARTRLMYSQLRDDILAVVASGCSTTNNNLAIQTDGGYEGIDVVHQPATKSLAALRPFTRMKQGTRNSNLLNVLEVCGDLLSHPCPQRAKDKRLVIFTQGSGLSKSLGAEDLDDLRMNVATYKEYGFRVDAICLCSEDDAKLLQQLDEEIEEEDENVLEISELLEKSKGFPLSNLFAFCKATGGVLMNFKEASSLLDAPTPKVKKAMAKFRGTLNIADIVRIPVKTYSFVNEAKQVAGKKISWDASVAKRTEVGVEVFTQHVASTKDDSPLSPEDLVDAYPYGPELVPEPNEVDTAAWSMHLPRGLHALGFVDQESVPQRFLMGPVDVVVPMQGVEGPAILMKSLVLALQAERLGILARFVSPGRGGPPRLVFLWPQIEVDGKGVMKNFFLFMVAVPMREDIRDLPFASLSNQLKNVPDKATNAFERYISSTMLEKEQENTMNDDEGDQDEFLWPPDTCNPSLDWFNICVAHRALAGLSGSDLPESTEWQKKIVEPASFINEDQRAAYENCIRDLKGSVPVLPVKKREKRKKPVHEALSGEMASIGDFLPEKDTVENEEDEDESVQANQDVHGAIDYEDALSTVTDWDTTDVSEENPVIDFRVLVKQNKFSFAAESLLVVIRRLIRNGSDDEKAVACLQALRETCIKVKKPKTFNSFLMNVVRKIQNENGAENGYRSFLRYVGTQGVEVSTIAVIHPEELALGQRKDIGSTDNGANGKKQSYLDWVDKQLKDVCSKKVIEPAMSSVESEL